MHGCGVKWTNDGAHVELAGHFSDDEYVGLSDVCDLKAAQWSAKQAQTAANVAIGLQVGSTQQYVPDVCYVAWIFVSMCLVADTVSACRRR